MNITKIGKEIGCLSRPIIREKNIEVVISLLKDTRTDTLMSELD